MAQRRPRPGFSLPATAPSAGQASSLDWVYRSDESGVERPAVLPGDVGQVDVVRVDAVRVDAVRARDARLEAAEQLVARYSRYAAAAGLIPLPAVDMVAVGAVQVKMVAALAAHYETRFNDHLGTSLVAGLLGGAGTAQLGYGVGWWLVKTVPIVGGLAAVAATPGFAFALTHAVGKVFVLHFEAGGTLLDFDPRAMRIHFEREVARASAQSVEAESEPA